MRYAQIQHLQEHYGSILHANIWKAVEQHHLDGLIVTANPRPNTLDPVAMDPRTRELVLERGVMFGFSRAAPAGVDETAFARQMNADLNGLGLDGVRHSRSDTCYALANAEDHAFDMNRFLDAWRGPVCKRPTRATGWTIEGMQGGRLGAFVARCNADANLDVIGETYTGPVGARPDMYPVAADAVKDDLRAAGFKRVRLAYDAQLGAPDQMNGILYVLERLPIS